ncbi:MAG: alpha/beta hydrolase family protein [Microthrixaceae bacterium]
MRLYFDDTDFDGQLQRSVAKADGEMANIGECLAIAATITPGDRDAWFQAWSSFAGGLVLQADRALAAGHHVSARQAYLRAAEYHRQSFFFHRDDLRCRELRTGYAASVAAFRAAMPLMRHEAEVLEGPLSGYLHTPAGAQGRHPTLLHIGGYDGTAEELYAAVAPALDRGYAFAAIDGPGQGGRLYDDHVTMRPDWEHVVPEMFDALVQHPRVDPTRVVLVGRSFGGLLAPRGAAGEQRLAALVVDPGQFDMGVLLRSRLGELLDRVDDPAADADFDSLMTIPPVRQLFAPRMVTHGVATPRAYCAEMLRYTNAGTVEQITCPSFVADNETDLVSAGQGEVLYDHLRCPKEFRRFTRAEGAEGHCEGMAAVVFWTAAFDWLDGVLRA